MSAARFRIKSLGSPVSEMPERSPLISAANTGTPARANPSAITCNETVFPVPVAPVTSPCRLASASVSHAGCSPLPIRIFSPLSANLLSELAGEAIDRLFRVHQNFLGHRHHTASRELIETGLRIPNADVNP